MYILELILKFIIIRIHMTFMNSRNNVNSIIINFNAIIEKIILYKYLYHLFIYYILKFKLCLY